MPDSFAFKVSLSYNLAIRIYYFFLYICFFLYFCNRYPLNFKKNLFKTYFIKMSNCGNLKISVKRFILISRLNLVESYKLRCVQMTTSFMYWLTFYYTCFRIDILKKNLINLSQESWFSQPKEKCRKKWGIQIGYRELQIFWHGFICDPSR